ncbi:MAG: S53 family peptidase, partial [Rudaea sp.]
MKKYRCSAALHAPSQSIHATYGRSLLLATFALLLTFVATFASAQPLSISPAAARNLVTAQVDSARRHALSGNRVAWASAQNDRGVVADDLLLRNLTVALNRTAEREQAFQQLLRDQQDTASPDYHRWLTPVEVGDRFGVSQHDIDAVCAWLSSQGLHVDRIANSRTRIAFSGSAAAVAQALATPLHSYAVGGEVRIANVDDPQIPAALAGVVQSVAGLHTIKYYPAHQVTAPQQALAAPSAIRPALTNCPPSGSCSYYVFPADFAKIYDLPASSINGSGQAIAIVSKTRVYDADNTNFMSLSGVTFAAPTVIVPPAGTDPGPPATTCTTSGSTNTCSKPSDAVSNQSEATLDVQRAGSVAPGATLKLIASADTGSGANMTDGIVIGIEYAIDTNPVPAQILSISYSSCESDNGASASIFFDHLYKQAALEGISVFVASGDGGVAGCEALDATPSTTQTISINTLCASGYVTCVGGTEFADQANPSAYWAASSGANYLSALGYIPEGAWNDPIDDSGNTQFAATGGGV